MSTKKECENFSNENIENPRLCKNGCGFYGSQNLDYYCSTCNKKINPVNMDVQKMEVETNIEKNRDEYKTMLNKVYKKNDELIETIEKKSSNNTKKRKRTRCNMCRKRLALHTIFVCPDCKTVTCSIHRYHEEHNCPKLDEMLERKNKQLKRSLPTIIATKIEKI